MVHVTPLDQLFWEHRDLPSPRISGKVRVAYEKSATANWVQSEGRFVAFL